MKLWRYTYTGPEDVPTGDTEHNQDEPGVFIIRERPGGHGECDLFVLVDRTDMILSATYRWVSTGTPEECSAAVAGLVAEGRDKP